MKFVVSALYKFVALDNYAELREPLVDTMRSAGVKGTILLAPEGINGTIAGERAGVDAIIAFLRSDERLASLATKESVCDEMPFYRTKVKLKKEIVTMGVEGIDPNRVVGTYVKPTEWNDLIADPDTIVIDTRNDYEVTVGTFRNAVNPATESFREFPRYVDENLKPGEDRKIAMFCTGGIRCEKATAYLKERGFENVFHLEGGILKYLEEVPESDSLWDGECFVFDHRVSVGHNLVEGSYQLCHACRHPINDADMSHPHYVAGVSCPHCHGLTTDAQRERFAERQRQVRLAAERNETHIGEAHNTKGS